MVTEPQQQQEHEQEEKYLSASFKVDPARLASRLRSLQLLLLHRRCASCWGTLVQDPTQGFDIEAAVHLKQIARHCSKEHGFIQPELPVMEAVFRILLSNGNQATTVESIYETLMERWSDPTNPRTPLPDKLYRMLSGDNFYGISQVSDGKKGTG